MLYNYIDVIRMLECSIVELEKPPLPVPEWTIDQYNAWLTGMRNITEYYTEEVERRGLINGKFYGCF